MEYDPTHRLIVARVVKNSLLLWNPKVC